MRKNKIILSCTDSLKYSNNRFLEEASSLGQELGFINPYTKSLNIHTNAQLPECDILIHRCTSVNYNDYDLFVASHFETFKRALITNPIDAFLKVRNKNWQHFYLDRLNIPTLDTYTLKEDYNPEILQKYSDKQSFIVKTQRGLGGKGVFLIKGQTSLEDFINGHAYMGDDRFIVQPFIKDKTEIRTFIINNKIEYVVEKVSRGSYKGNKKWSKTQVYTPDDNIQRQAGDIVEKLKVLGLSYYALDLFIIGDVLNVVEINLVPGYEALEECTGENVAKNILQHLINQKEQLS